MHAYTCMHMCRRDDGCTESGRNLATIIGLMMTVQSLAEVWTHTYTLAAQLSSSCTNLDLPHDSIAMSPNRWRVAIDADLDVTH